MFIYWKPKGGLFFMPKKNEKDEPIGIKLDEIEFVDDAEIGEIEFLDLGEVSAEEIPIEVEEAPKKKRKPVYTYEPVHGEKSIRKKFKDGVFQNYEVTIVYKRVEVFDEVINRHRDKQVQERRTFYDLDEAISWRNKCQGEKISAKRKMIDYKKHGATLIDAAEAYYKEMEKMVKKGKKTESYLNQLRIQTDHFKKYFTGERTTYVKTIDTKQIEDYFQFEEDRGIARASIMKYKSHLKAIWNFMIKDKATYGVTENIVIPAEVTAPKTEYKAVALDYKQIQELMIEACQLDDPTFLYMVVFSMTQGLRRGELCGLMWKDIDFTTSQVTICHSRVQLVTKDTTKLPKREKIRKIELHKVGSDTLKLYKEWQEQILGRKVKPNEFVMQWEINLLQNYVCHTGKVSRRWKEIFTQINKAREKAKKEALPYGRIHDGRHTYITLSLQGIKKDDGTIIPPASYFQVFQSAGHSLPKSMQNTSTTVYNEDIDARWDITRFWDNAITMNIADEWNNAKAKREADYQQLTDFQKEKKKAQKEKRLEKAKQERMNSNPPEDVLQEYEES